jgi:hypothetical protein
MHRKADEGGIRGRISTEENAARRRLGGAGPDELPGVTTSWDGGWVDERTEPEPPQIERIALLSLTDPLDSGDVCEGARFQGLDWSGTDREFWSFTGCAFRQVGLDGTRLRGTTSAMSPWPSSTHLNSLHPAASGATSA